MKAGSQPCRGPFASRAGSGCEGHARSIGQLQKRRISFQTVVAYSGIRAFADDVRLERDEGLCRGTVVTLEEILGHIRHSDQVEARDQKHRDQKHPAHPGEYRQRRSRRIHVHWLRQVLVLFVHDEAWYGGDGGS